MDHKALLALIKAGQKTVEIARVTSKTPGPTGKDGKDGLSIKGDTGPQGLPGRDGKEGAQGLPGKDGGSGRDGVIGSQGLPGKDGLPGSIGENGADGFIPEHKWNANSLSFQNPDGTWGKKIDLTGPTGASKGGSGGGFNVTGGTLGQVLMKGSAKAYDMYWADAGGGGPASTDALTEGSTNLYYTEARVTANTAVAANTAKNTYPTADSSKLAGVEAGAEVNVQSDWNAISGDSFIVNKPSIPPVAPVDSVNSQTGAVVLNTSHIAENVANLYYTDVRVAANTSVTANTAKNSYPSGDNTKVGFISVTQAVDLDTMEANIATNNAKNTYPSADSTKLAGIETSATADQTGAEIKTAYQAQANAYTDTKNTKLAGIATAATANDTDANLKNRANHTGTQVFSTVTNSAGITDIAQITQVAYDALSPPVATTLYYIVG